jgi:hypothetical protein
MAIPREKDKKIWNLATLLLPGTVAAFLIAAPAKALAAALFG